MWLGFDAIGGGFGSLGGNGAGGAPVPPVADHILLEDGSDLLLEDGASLLLLE